MIRYERRTGFEWMDTPFLITRILVAAWGAVMAFALIVAVAAVLGDVHRRLFPPPPPPADGEMEVHATSCGWENAPYRALPEVFWFTASPIAGLVLVWRRARLAFLVTGGGWMLTASILLMMAALNPEVEIAAQALFLGFAPPLWLGLAAWKVGPPPTPDPDLIIAVDEPETGFEWMDSALNTFLAPFRKGIAFAARILRSGS